MESRPASAQRIFYLPHTKISRMMNCIVQTGDPLPLLLYSTGPVSNRQRILTSRLGNITFLTMKH
jgi:hypothetical protein